MSEGADRRVCAWDDMGCRDTADDGVTLAMVYPAIVYVRAGYGDKWHAVVGKDEADAFLRAFGWELETN